MAQATNISSVTVFGGTGFLGNEIVENRWGRNPPIVCCPVKQDKNPIAWLAPVVTIGCIDPNGPLIAENYTLDFVSSNLSFWHSGPQSYPGLYWSPWELNNRHRPGKSRELLI